jgi:hypothetical protein
MIYLIHFCLNNNLPNNFSQCHTIHSYRREFKQSRYYKISRFAGEADVNNARTSIA